MLSRPRDRAARFVHHRSLALQVRGRWVIQSLLGSSRWTNHEEMPKMGDTEQNPSVTRAPSARQQAFELLQTPLAKAT